MQSCKYNYTFGWRYHDQTRHPAPAQNRKGKFLVSLLVSLAIVFFIAQILSLIDYHIQNRSLQGYTIMKPQLISTAQAAHLKGRILLQVQEKGEAWYVHPDNGTRYFLGRPADAFKVMREQSLGISQKDYNSFRGWAPNRLSGKILLNVDSKGEAYYVNPTDLRIHYLGRPEDAFKIMRELGLGITNNDLKQIVVASGHNVHNVSESNPATDVTKTRILDGGLSMGIDVKAYCKKNNYKIATSGIEAECEKMEKAYLAKVALYEGKNDTEKVQPVSETVDEGESAPEATVPSVLTVNLDDGPDIRVGIFANDTAQTVQGSGPYTIQDSNRAVLLSASAGQTVSIDYLEEQGVYAYGIGALTNQTPSFIRLVPQDDTDVVFEVTSYESRPGWNKSLNDNKFLGAIELRYNSAKNRTWIINELPMETYLKGIAETTNYSHGEYQKALLTAARTYATYHRDRGTKHGNEYFHVDATYDQVYKGYGSQIRLTKVTEAVEATKGQVVTYNGKLAITPYFSWSDGRTRSMKEVWYVDHPWLQSVVEPEGYTKTTLFGHGVGMSAIGALILARDHDYTYDRILKYYYTGVDLTDNYADLFGDNQLTN